MKPEMAFDIGLRDYSVHQLSLEDSRALQALYDQCQDYMLLVDGHPAGPTAGVDELQDVPPGRSFDDKFMFGIVNQQQDLVGVLDTLLIFRLLSDRVWG